MGGQSYSGQVEVLGTSDDINEGMIEMLLGDNCKVGRQIPVPDVMINRAKKAAFVTL